MCNPAGPAISKKQKAATDTKQAHAVQPRLAVAGWLWQPWQPQALGHSQAAAACPWEDGQHFGGHTLQLHPQSSAEEEEGWELPGCLAEAPLCGAGLRWQGCACGSPSKDGDYRAGEQQARLPPRLQHKSSSFQLTLSTSQAAQGMMPEFAKGKKKNQRGFLKGTAQGAQARPLPARGTQKMQRTTSPWQGAMGGRMGKAHPCHTQGFLWVHQQQLWPSSDSKHRPSMSCWSSVQQPVC